MLDLSVFELFFLNHQLKSNWATCLKSILGSIPFLCYNVLLACIMVSSQKSCKTCSLRLHWALALFNDQVTVTSLF